MYLPQGTRHLRLLLLNPKPFEASQLKVLLHSLSGLSVVGEAASVDELLVLHTRLRADLLMFLTDWSGGELLSDLQRLQRHDPVAGLIVLSMEPGPLRVAAAVAAGARGYVSIESLHDLPGILYVVAQGGLACCSTSTRQLADRLTLRKQLSPRERLVAAQVAAGLSNADIARSLGIKLPTVETHIGNITRKVGGLSRVDIATWWLSMAGASDSHNL